MKDVIATSYAALAEAEARALRYLSLFPGVEFGLGAAAALLDVDDDRAERWLYELESASMLDTPTVDRWRFHDLIKAMVTGLADEHDDRGDQDAARARLMAYYLRVGAAASHQIQRNLFRVGWAYDLAGDGPPLFETAEEALEWLDTELDNVLALQQLAERMDRPDVVWMLSEVYWVWCQTRRRHQPWMLLCERGIAAEQCRNPIAQARLMALLSLAYRDRDQRGDRDQALELSKQLEHLAHKSGDWLSRATALEQLAALSLGMGDPKREAEAIPVERAERAIEYLHEGLDILERNGSRRRANGLLHRLLGRAYAAAGNTRQSIYHFDIAYVRFGAPSVDDTHQLMRTMVERAKTELAAGEPRAAINSLNHAISMHHDHPRLLSTAEAHLLAARAHHALGTTEAARLHLDTALDLYSDNAEHDNPHYAHARKLAETLPARDAGHEAGDQTTPESGSQQ